MTIKMNVIKYTFFLCMISTHLLGIDYDLLNPFKLQDIFTLPQRFHYHKNRIPLVFTSTESREDAFTGEKRKRKAKTELIHKNTKSSEEFHKSKCGIKEFHSLREIALTYTPETRITWESCERLEIEIKRAKLDGRDNEIPILLKTRIQAWKERLTEEIEETIAKPIPKLLPKLIPVSLQKEVEKYHNILINHIYDGIYMGVVLSTESPDSEKSSFHWTNRIINEFNMAVYGEKISLEEKRQMIETNKTTLEGLNLSYEYSYMISEILEIFPASTQKKENELVLQKINDSVKIIDKRLDIGSFPLQKKLLRASISCLEMWPDWHLNNLRMAYYYNFFYEYGKETYFTEQLKKDDEAWKLAKSIEDRFLGSDVFRYRLEVIVRDACMTAYKTPKEIEASF